MTVGKLFHRDAAATANEQSPTLVRVRFTSIMLLFAERLFCQLFLPARLRQVIAWQPLTKDDSSWCWFSQVAFFSRLSLLFYIIAIVWTKAQVLYEVTTRAHATTRLT